MLNINTVLNIKYLRKGLLPTAARIPSLVSISFQEGKCVFVGVSMGPGASG